MPILEITGVMTVTLGCHQWNYTDGIIDWERNVNLTEFGVLSRDKLGITSYYRRARFSGNPTTIGSIRQLSQIAGRRALTVIFTPDEAFPATTYTVDWPPTLQVENPLDHWQSVELGLIEQSPGL